MSTCTCPICEMKSDLALYTALSLAAQVVAEIEFDAMLARVVDTTAVVVADFTPTENAWFARPIAI